MLALPFHCIYQPTFIICICVCLCVCFCCGSCRWVAGVKHGPASMAKPGSSSKEGMPSFFTCPRGRFLQLVKRNQAAIFFEVWGRGCIGTWGSHNYLMDLKTPIIELKNKPWKHPHHHHHFKLRTTLIIPFSGGGLIVHVGKLVKLILDMTLVPREDLGFQQPQVSKCPELSMRALFSFLMLGDASREDSLSSPK